MSTLPPIIPPQSPSAVAPAGPPPLPATAAPVLGYAQAAPSRSAPASTAGRIGTIICSVVFWFIVGCVAIGVMYGLLLMPVAGILMAPVLFLLLLLFPALRQAQRLVRRRQVDTVLDALAEAIRLNMPLTQMLGTMASCERGRFRRHLESCRALLLQGASLAVAVEEAFPATPRHVLEQLQAAEPAGQLGPALARLADEPRGRMAADPHRQSALALTYICIYTVCLGLVLSLFMIVVMPKYAGMFRDFKLPLGAPWPIRVLMELADTTLFPLLMALPVVALIIYCGRVAWSFVPLRFLQGASLPAVGDQLVNFIPLLGRLRRDRALAASLAVVADCTAAGMSLEVAVTHAAQMQVHLPTTARLNRWAERLRVGEPIAKAAKMAGLPEAVGELLGAAQLSASVPQVLRFLAAHYQSRFSRGLLLLQHAAVPAVAILFGILTAMVWFTILGPMVKLMDYLAGRAL